MNIEREALVRIYEKAGDLLWKTRRRRDTAGHHCDYRDALHGVKEIAKEGLAATEPRPDRDRVAERALIGLLAASGPDGGLSVQEVAHAAYAVADAMLEARDAPMTLSNDGSTRPFGTTDIEAWTADGSPLGEDPDGSDDPPDPDWKLDDMAVDCRECMDTGVTHVWKGTTRKWEAIPECHVCGLDREPEGKSDLYEAVGRFLCEAALGGNVERRPCTGIRASRAGDALPALYDAWIAHGRETNGERNGAVNARPREDGTYVYANTGPAARIDGGRVYVAPRGTADTPVTWTELDPEASVGTASGEPHGWTYPCGCLRLTTRPRCGRCDPDLIPDSTLTVRPSGNRVPTYRLDPDGIETLEDVQRILRIMDLRYHHHGGKNRVEAEDPDGRLFKPVE